MSPELLGDTNCALLIFSHLSNSHIEQINKRRLQLSMKDNTSQQVKEHKQACRPGRMHWKKGKVEYTCMVQCRSRGTGAQYHLVFHLIETRLDRSSCPWTFIDNRLDAFQNVFQNNGQICLCMAGACALIIIIMFLSFVCNWNVILVDKVKHTVRASASLNSDGSDNNDIGEKLLELRISAK